MAKNNSNKDSNKDHVVWSDSHDGYKATLNDNGVLVVRGAFGTGVAIKISEQKLLGLRNALLEKYPIK